ncbi:predicted protein [uncultured Candidatus Thioglobus sp.]|nr:predicted protein [uncultured Candidatus Thioglobus sp.]
MKNINKKRLFYLFILANIGLLAYAYTQDNFLNPAMIKAFLTSSDYFLLSYIIFILILIIRGLTLIPGTAFIITGVYLFTIWQVYLAIQIAIICYCLIIYNFSHRLKFNIPQKILDYEHKIKSREIPIIFALCFIPGVSINILIYFLSIINVKLKNILIGVISGTCVTSIFYIFLWKGLIESADYFV